MAKGNTPWAENCHWKPSALNTEDFLDVAVDEEVIGDNDGVLTGAIHRQLEARRPLLEASGDQGSDDSPLGDRFVLASTLSSRGDLGSYLPRVQQMGYRY